jgi:hypothetical protein
MQRTLIPLVIVLAIIASIAALAANKTWIQFSEDCYYDPASISESKGGYHSVWTKCKENDDMDIKVLWRISCIGGTRMALRAYRLDKKGTATRDWSYPLSVEETIEQGTSVWRLYMTVCART